MRVVTRKFEAAVGGKIINFACRKMIEQAALVKKQVQLPKNGMTMHYYERCPKQDDAPTLLLCHGITDQAKNFAALVILLQKELPQWRMIIPDLPGHGSDIERVDSEHPNPKQMLESVQDLLAVLQVQQCYALGISMGGGLAYFLQEQQPEMVLGTILIAPALEAVVDPQFVADFLEGRKNHFCFESRNDVKELFRDLAPPNRKRKNPVPKFFLEAIWQDRVATTPPGHFRTLFESLLEERGQDPEWLGSPVDLAPDAPRLVIWPQEDFIANHAKGRAFFAQSSPQTTTFHSLPNCGHVFHSDGKSILEHAAPLIIDYLKEAEEKEQAPL